MLASCMVFLLEEALKAGTKFLGGRLKWEIMVLKVPDAHIEKMIYI